MRKRSSGEGAVIRKLLTIDEAAQAMSLGRSLMYKLVRTGQVRSIKICDCRRIEVEALEEFIKQQLAQQ